MAAAVFDIRSSISSRFIGIPATFLVTWNESLASSGLEGQPHLCLSDKFREVIQRGWYVFISGNFVVVDLFREKYLARLWNVDPIFFGVDLNEGQCLIEGLFFTDL